MMPMAKKVFRVYPFLDLRTLRKLYPIAEQAEEDFGLTRSTTDDARAFLRQCQDADGADDLLEFLDDE